MADKSVGELIAAQSVTPTDLFVLEQNGTAKKLTGQVLENWLVSFADGHGGIHSIKKLSTSGLVDTYRITLADTTTFDFDVTNGRSITGISKTSTSGLVDTYTITYNNGPASTFTVKNGEKGDKGDNAYIWIKYASQKPTETSPSMGDLPDDWIGIYYGKASTAPTDWKQYKWFQIKGEKGNTGEAATLATKSVTYQVGDSGTIIPSGAWGSSIPVVSQGKYLWTKTEVRFNTGDPIVSYSVARMGIDGSGSVSSVANISPDGNGNVPLTAENINALPNTGGDLTGELRMNGQTISGLNAPMANDQAANMGFVNQQMKKAAPRNLLDNSDFRNPVNQRGFTKHTGGRVYSLDRWQMESANGESFYDSANGCFTLYPGALLCQPLENKNKFLGRTLTLAVCDNDGGIRLKSGTITELPTGTAVKAYCAKDDGTFNIFAQIAGHLESIYIYAINTSASNKSVKWFAVYEGEYTEDTLPEYQPKGYGAELAECQRYYQIRSANNIAAVDMRPTMRLSSPTITSVTGGYAYSADL